MITIQSSGAQRVFDHPVQVTVVRVGAGSDPSIPETHLNHSDHPVQVTVVRVGAGSDPSIPDTHTHLNHSDLLRLVTAFFVGLSFVWMENKKTRRYGSSTGWKP